MTFGAVLARLTASIKSEQNGLGHTELETIQDLITGCTADEVKANSGAFATLCHTLTESLIASKKSVLGVHLTTHAIKKLQAHQTQLTSIHSDLCQLCLDSKCLNPALDFLHVDYTDINKEDNMFEIKHVVIYHYYGGMIYTALKNFDRALYFFETILTLPLPLSQYNTAILNEAFKKYSLISILSYGNVPDNMIWKKAKHSLFRHPDGAAYIKFMIEYPSLDYNNVSRIVTTYTADVATHAGLKTEQEAESFILKMIDEREIFATINQRNGMVVFNDNPESFNSAKVFKKLHSEMDECIGLIKTLKTVDCAPIKVQSSESEKE